MNQEETPETVTITKQKLAEALTKYGLGGSELVLRNIWRMLSGGKYE